MEDGCTDFEQGVDKLLTALKEQLLLEHASAVGAVLGTPKGSRRATGRSEASLVDAEAVLEGAETISASEASFRSPRSNSAEDGPMLSMSGFPFAVKEQRSRSQLVETKEDEDGLTSITTLRECPQEVLKRWENVVREALNDFYGFRQKFRLAEGWFALAGSTQAIKKVDSVGGLFRKQTTLGLMAEEEGEPTHLKGCISLVEKYVVVHPNARLRLVWFLLSVVLCILEFVFVPIDFAFGVFDRHENTTAIFITPALFWSIDILMSCSTGVYVNGILEMKLLTILRTYLAGWFAFDFILVMALWSSIFLQSVRSLSLVRAIRLLRLFQLLRIGRVQANSEYFMLDALDSSKIDILLRVVKINLLYAAGLHIIACAWFAMCNSPLTGDASADLGGEWLSLYVASLAQAVGFSFGRYSDEDATLFVRAISLFMQFLGVFLLTAYLSLMIQVLRRLENAEGARLSQACASYAQRHRVSSELAVRMRRFSRSYYAHTLHQRALKAEADLIDEFPPDLKLDLCEEANAPVVRKCFVLEKLFLQHPAVVREVCGRALEEVSIRYQFSLFDAGTRARSMAFVLSGQFTYSLRDDYGGSAGNDLLARIRKATIVKPGDQICEPALWTEWIHVGKLTASAQSTVLEMDPVTFQETLRAYSSAYTMCQSYARKFVHILNQREKTYTDLTKFCLALHDLEDWSLEHLRDDHLVFISHFKHEAGTEAALIREALMKKIEDDRGNLNNTFSNPVFLDSELLSDLSALGSFIACSHNVVVLLTPNVLSRPWCLVEMVLALRCNRNVVLVEIQRPDLKMKYPDDVFYKRLLAGGVLDASSMKVLDAFGVTLEDVERALRIMFHKVALHYSPHKSSALRDVEITRLLQRCPLAEDRCGREGEAWAKSDQLLLL